ncbi:GNAT family N-acetyltransferase [Hymenobacter oligotrophus]|uniref:GNAT family N-acetyltransferase n=1 Tax=Hymenobacter oligotrophus TaxID=2319843 RepID=A0A3B7R247_9BACT|nr:GNAT family N-acetyltransferase [Hymenobacter oligotrophus]AYA38065.1 GNAT family N-acetyltransferase [Hymenobacter oligotrophus]
MAEFTIRPLVFPADEPAYTALRTDGLTRLPECFRVTPADDARRPLRWAAYHPTADEVIWGAFAGAALVGTVGFVREPLDKMRHKGLLRGMYVHPKAGRRGVGRALLREAIGFARQLPGLEQILLTLVATNAPARALYAAEGFVSTGIEPRAMKWQGRYFDEETMLLFLHPEAASEPGR